MNEIDTAMGMEYGWIIGLVVLVVIVVLIFVAMKPKAPVPKYNSPMDILKKRYAKGEISKEEYEEKRSQINT